jgi:hypothetical protein
MKIAYLIMAHNQPYHLQRLVNALSTNYSSFLIHVDKKSDLSIFNPYDFPENVRFIDDRVRVNHGGFSMVKAMIQLIKSAINEDEFDYFQFISGWDYPIKCNSYIYDFLSNNYPMNYMNFYRLCGSADYVNNITKYYFTDFIGNSPKVFQKTMKAFQYIFKNIPWDRQFVPEMVPYRGSSWFCLNKATIHYIINFLNTPKGKRLYRFFENSQCGDEIFFQTIVMNSPFAEYCRFYDKDINQTYKNENKAYLHYINWDPARENPAIFNLSDFQSLMESPALYARKFNEAKSLDLLYAIDEQIKKPPIDSPPSGYYINEEEYERFVI